MADATTFHYLLNLAANERLKIHLMNDITTYLYGSPNNDVHMKISEGFQLPRGHNPHS